MPNRRAYPRVNAGVTVECLADGESGPVRRRGSIANLSAGGVFFQTGPGLRPGQTVLLRLLPEGMGHDSARRALRAWARIIRVEAPPPDALGFAPAGIAAEFTESPLAEVYSLAV